MTIIRKATVGGLNLVVYFTCISIRLYMLVDVSILTGLQFKSNKSIF
jgi:hypothetical protein